jgi:outer membrane receptor for ferrienterochelin and colicin
MDRANEYQLDTLFQYLGRGGLPAVTVNSPKKKNSEEGRDNPSIITREKLQAMGVNSIGDALLQVPGVHLNTGLLVIGGLVAFSPSASDEPILVINGSQAQLGAYVGDPSETSPLLSALKTMNIRDIEYIRVLTGPEASEYGMRGGHGVIEVHTTTKQFLPTKPDDSRKAMMIGYSIPRPLKEETME